MAAGPDRDGLPGLDSGVPLPDGLPGSLAQGLAEARARLAALASSLAPVPPGLRPVPGEVLAALARDLNLPLRLVERAALEAVPEGVPEAVPLVPARYLRNMRTFTPRDQARFLESEVAMPGLGGLGGHLLELLARAGVGRIRAADGDRFEESNLNRQLLSAQATLGRSKARAAVLRAAQANPAVELTVREECLDQEGLAAFIRGADLVLDALGGLAPRADLARAAAREGLPLLTAAVAGTSGYVALVLPGEPGPADFLGVGARTGGEPAEVLLGTPGPTVALAASLQASQALSFLARGAACLSGRMLLFDLADMTFQTVSLSR